MNEDSLVSKKTTGKDVSISWHSMSNTDVLDKLETPLEEGLSTEEVKARQEKYGLNELTEAPPTTFWEMLWAQINSFVIYMLLAASIISALLGDYVELSLFWRLWFSMPSWVSSRRARPKLLWRH